MPNQNDSSGERDIRTEDATNDRDYGGDGPRKIGVTSDNQPDLVVPSGVNERDHGSVGESPPACDLASRNGPSDPDRGSGSKQS